MSLRYDSELSLVKFLVLQQECESQNMHHRTERSGQRKGYIPVPLMTTLLIVISNSKLLHDLDNPNTLLLRYDPKQALTNVANFVVRVQQMDVPLDCRPSERKCFIDVGGCDCA